MLQGHDFDDCTKRCLKCGMGKREALFLIQAGRIYDCPERFSHTEDLRDYQMRTKTGRYAEK